MKRTRMRNLLLLFILFISTYAFSNAQIVIKSNTDDPKTTLEVFSESQRDSLKNVMDGRTILNSTTNCINYYSNNNWYALCGDCLPETPIVKVDSAIFKNGELSVYFDENKARNEKINSFIIKILPLNWIFSTDHSPFRITVKLDSTFATIAVAGIGKCGAGKDALTDPIWFFSNHPCGSQESVIDSRDGQVYQLVEMGDQCWLNGYLRFVPSTKINYLKEKEFIFYEWVKEFSLDENGMCPAGFHIPDKAEADLFSLTIDDPYNQLVTQEAYDQQLKEFGVEFLGGYDNKKVKIFSGQSDFFWIQDFKDKQDAYLGLLNNRGVIIATVSKRSFMPIRCIKN